MENKQWDGATYGTGWMHRTLIRSLRFLDVRLFYWFSYIFVIPVALIKNPSRRSSYAFYREALGFGRLKSALQTYLNHCMFAQVVIDRFAMYAGKRFEIEIDGDEVFQSLISQPEGFIQLSSHVGNYEIAGYSLSSGSKTINAVVYGHEKQSVMDNRNSMFTKTGTRMIPIKEDMSHLFEIDRALVGGDIVSFPSDRYMGDARTIECEFFSRKAKFPMGPFSVATMRGLNVLAINVMKEGAKKYHIYITELPYDKSASRKQQMTSLLSAYVAELERILRKYPSQWYNFYDFWNVAGTDGAGEPKRMEESEKNGRIQGSGNVQRVRENLKRMGKPKENG